MEHNIDYTIESALLEIKISIEDAIRKNGTAGKNNLIRSQKPIKLIHEVVKNELIKYGIEENRLRPLLGDSSGELSLSGFIKKKDQDICVIPIKQNEKTEILDLDGILYGQKDIYGKEFTERTISINVRSQLSSSAKNFDTLYERTFAEALNLHIRCPKMVLGELYMIAVREYDSDASNNNKVKYKKKEGLSNHIEKYILSFNAINNRRSVEFDHFKYEKVCLLIVDFSKNSPVIYSTTNQLVKDNLLKEKSQAVMENLCFDNFIKDLLDIYHTRF